jgi:hypothetical protein
MGVWNDFKTGMKVAVTRKAEDEQKPKVRANPVAKPTDQLAAGAGAIADNIRKKKEELKKSGD